MSDDATHGARPSAGRGPVPPEDLPPTAQLILRTAQDILAERGYAELTMTAIAQVSGVNRALVSYYFGGKAGLLAALVDSLFLSPEIGSIEEVSAGRGGADLAGAFLDWQQTVSANDRVNRMLYELLPHALRDPGVRSRFAEEYRVYREVDGGCLSGAPRELSRSGTRGPRGREHRGGRGSGHPARPRPGRLRPHGRLARLARRDRQLSLPAAGPQGVVALGLRTSERHAIVRSA